MTVRSPARRPRAWPVVAVVLAAVVVAAFAVRGDDRRSGPPFDSRSTDADGMLAYVELLQRVGLDPSSGGVPPPGAGGTVVLAVDDLDGEATAALEQWVAAGGTLVVADVSSGFAPSPVGSEPLSGRPGPCPLGSLGDVDELDIAVGRGFDPGPGPVCFPVGAASFVVERALGDGRVVAVGDRTFLRNDRLAVADHAVLGVRLAELGGGPVRVLLPTPGTAAGDRLVDLVSPGAWAFGALGAIAFAVYALVRAWRFGRPVPERQPVAIDGSELVVATGRLLERSGDHQRSATLVHDDLRRWLEGRFGVPVAAGPEDALRSLAPERVAAGIAPAVLERALTPPEVVDGAGLLEYATAAAEVRNALREGTTAWTT